MSDENKRYAVVNTTRNQVYYGGNIFEAKDVLERLVKRQAAVYECKYSDYVDYPNNRAYTYKVMHNFDANKMYGTVVAIEHCEAYNKDLGLSIDIKPSNEVMETMRYRIMEVCRF